MFRIVPLTALAAGVVVLALAGCGSGASSDSGGSAGSGATGSTQASTGSSSSSGPAKVATSDSELGTILVANGRTLYLFEKDSGSKSSCSGDCAANWPPLQTTGDPTAAGSADASKLGTTMRDDGTTQVIYAGHPLYFFVGDKQAGDTNGQEVDAFGAEWYALQPSGDRAESKSSGNNSGGYGY